MRGEVWRRYAAPAAFLLAATIAIVLIRSGVESGRKAGRPPAQAPSVPTKLTVTLTGTTTTTATTTAARAVRNYWTVRAGDTFGLISARTGVPVATIEQLNPTVKSTSLFIGEKIRLR